MSRKTQRVIVQLTRIDSPTEFWIKIPTNDHSLVPSTCSNADLNKQKTHYDYLRWIKDRAEWKCHLAFLTPIDLICWSLTAIEKFKMYAEQFEEIAISVPHTVDTSSGSTSVILWGLKRQQNITNERNEHQRYVWRNINLQMVFQGVARTIVHIEQLSTDFAMPRLNVNELQMFSTINKNHGNAEHHRDVANCKMSHKKVNRWLPALASRAKKIEGTPVFIDNELMIYVQEWENRECIKHISNVLTKWHQNCAKTSRKFWNNGNICTAKRNSDGMYHRAKIQRVYAKRRECLIQWIDFGYTEMVHFERLSTHIEFTDVPIQMRKYHLSNVMLISNDQTDKARQLCNQLICNQPCVIHIHDNADMEHRESIACSVQSLNVPLDLSSLLISNGLVQYKPQSNRQFKEVTGSQVDSERLRKESDEPIIKNSSELHDYGDFKEFYNTHKAINPKDEANAVRHAIDSIDDDDDDDDDSRIFELFEMPTKRSLLGENEHDRRINCVVSTPHPMVDRITEHFKLMNIQKSVFYCCCVCVMDPVTLLVQLHDMKPLTICHVEEKQKYFPLQDYSPVIAFKDHAWRRGIVWKKLSTNKHSILFVDTLQISEVSRNMIQKCPVQLLGTLVPYAKVHLSQIIPNERMRASDISPLLQQIVINKDLFAYVIAKRHVDADDDVPEIKLYASEHSKRSIYSSLVKQNFYKRIL